MNNSKLPNSFVWTKVQAQGGQTLQQILNRKELEHELGGTFWWGVGECKIQTVRDLLEKVPQPTVLFSRMRSPPSPQDKSPKKVLLWEEFKTEKGNERIPWHSIITSRAVTRSGRPKRSHYAITCGNGSGLSTGSGGTLDISGFRNFGSKGKRIGSSQTTVVVERTRNNSGPLSYPMTARAILVAPYAVQLAGSRMLTDREVRLLNEVSAEGRQVSDWLAVARTLRRI